MARDILSGFGHDTHKKQAPRARSGGIESARDVHAYRPPKGPTSIGNRGPGLGGDNYGSCGVQGPKAIHRAEGGHAGIGGSRKGKGSQR